MAGVMILDALRKQTFAATLSPPRESGAAALCVHARAKTMLAFARSLRCLIGAFHGAVERTRTVKVTLRLSMSASSCSGGLRPPDVDTRRENFGGRRPPLQKRIPRSRI